MWQYCIRKGMMGNGLGKASCDRLGRHGRIHRWLARARALNIPHSAAIDRWVGPGGG